MVHGDESDSCSLAKTKTHPATSFGPLFWVNGSVSMRSYAPQLKIATMSSSRLVYEKSGKHEKVSCSPRRRNPNSS